MSLIEVVFTVTPGRGRALPLMGKPAAAGGQVFGPSSRGQRAAKLRSESRAPLGFGPLLSCPGRASRKLAAEALPLSYHELLMSPGISVLLLPCLRKWEGSSPGATAPASAGRRKGAGGGCEP